MKRILAILALAVLTGGLMTSCASTQPVGLFYTEVRLPAAVGDTEVTPSKMGVAVSRSICNLVATGDSSITTACANGGIRKIHHVDWETSSLFGMVSTYRCVVWGE